MSIPFDIAGAIGRKKLAAALEVGETAIGNAVVRGAFPASWYPVVSALAKDSGVDCPMSAFNWKTSEPAPSSEATNAR